jgi:hypothetical protein
VAVRASRDGQEPAPAARAGDLVVCILHADEEELVAQPEGQVLE